MIMMMLKMITYLCANDDDDHNDSLKLEKLGVVLSSYYRPPLKCVLCVLLVQSSGKYCAALKQQFDSNIVQQTAALEKLKILYPASGSKYEWHHGHTCYCFLGTWPATRS